MEPDLRSLFSLRGSSPAFEQQLLALLPEAFVGGYAKLRAAAQLAAQMVATACREAGQEVPPWRSRAALLSRWQRQGSHDTRVAAPASRLSGAAPAAAAPPPQQASEPADAGSRLLRAHQESRRRPASPKAKHAAALAAFPAARVACGFDAAPSEPAAAAGAAAAWTAEAAPAPAAKARLLPPPQPVAATQDAPAATRADKAAGWALAASEPATEAAASAAENCSAVTLLRGWLSPVPGGKLPPQLAPAAKQQQRAASAKGWAAAGEEQGWSAQLPRVHKVRPEGLPPPARGRLVAVAAAAPT